MQTLQLVLFLDPNLRLWKAMYKVGYILKYKDYFQWNPVGINGRHDRQFPIELPKTFIDVLPEAELILDPFLGSGTTAVACKELKRNCIGIEISPEYFKIAENRIKQTQEMML